MKNDNFEENKSKNDDLKTPGGISKSFLTPCRRLGLSRKWKSGPSPFISPLTQNADNENKTPQDSVNKKKTSKRLHDAANTESTKLDDDRNFENEEVNEDIVSTPVRESSFSRRKKSKLTSLESNTQEDDRKLKYNGSQNTKKQLDNIINSDCKNYTENELSRIQESNDLEQPSRNSVIRDQSSKSTLIRSDSISKDCVVVIQKQLIDTDNGCNSLKILGNDVKNDDENIPLSRIKEINNSDSKNELDDCSDFCDKNVKLLLKINKLEDKNTSTSDLNQNKRNNRKAKVNALINAGVDEQLSSQTSNSVDDDDDFDFDRKKTILIKKTYTKTKLSRAKSTGSITQKDIEELKARIEAKQRLLVAKTNSKEFEELRALIKKWQKGCQEALAELMDLMKKKIPENQSMSYSELLKTLNIPPGLAGYDEENDCFVSPNSTDFLLV